MKKLLKPFLRIFLTAGLLAIFLSGCQTSKGFGRDVEDLGESIQGR